jgi:hypothetical protein
MNSGNGMFARRGTAFQRQEEHQIGASPAIAKIPRRSWIRQAFAILAMFPH